MPTGSTLPPAPVTSLTRAMIKKMLSLCAALLLSACAAPNIPKNYAINAASGTGVTAGTITYEGGYALFRLQLENVDTGKEHQIEHGSSQTLSFTLAFKGEDPHPLLKRKGAPFAVELPAGKYRLKYWYRSAGQLNVTSAGPTGLEFEVSAGQAIYLGNFHFREPPRMGGSSAQSLVTLSYRAERDLPALQATFPVLSTVTATQALAAGTVIDNLGGGSNGKLSIPIFVPIAR